MKTLSIPLDDELLADIKKASSKAQPHVGRPVSSWVRLVLTEATKKELQFNIDEKYRNK